MEPSRKRPRVDDSPADSGKRECNDASNIPHRTQSSNTFDGTGISNSQGNLGVGRDANVTTNHNITNHNITNHNYASHNVQPQPDTTTDTRRALLESLRFHQIDTRRQTIKDAHPKTCRWFLQTEMFKQWEQSGTSDHNKFLWIRGKPGAGKSTLMKFLRRHFLKPARQKTKQESIVSFFFNARGDELEKSITGMYRSLLLQLLEIKPESQLILDQFRPGHQWTVDSLRTALEDTAQFLEETPIICLIDALDECDQNQVRDVVSFLETLAGNSTSLHICFASRHYPRITQRGLGIVLEEGIGHQEDIAEYLSSGLRIGHGQRAENIRSKLKDKARGVFMWVVLVVDILNRDYDAGDGRNLEKKIDQLPGDLSSLFRDILTRDNNNPKALLLCIQWILFAKQPLTPTQLYLAILSGLEPEALSDCHAEGYEDLAADAERYILDKSKGVAEWTKARSPTVQFIHESVNDFLWKEKGLAELFPELVPQIEGYSHEALKACCLAYTNFVADFSGGESCEDMSRQEVTQKFLLLEYANSGLLYHADQAGNHGIDQHGFLTTFPRSEWVRQHNLLEKFAKRQYTPQVSLLYILAEAGLSALIRAHSSRQSCFEIEAERYGIPILAASATKQGAAVLAMLELEPARVPDFDFQEFYDRLPPGMDQLRDLSINFDFQRKRGLLDQLIEHGSDLAALFYVITKEPCTHSANEQQDNLLQLALKHNKPETAKLFLERSSSIPGTSRDGQTPLHYASSFGNAELARLLLDRGCEVMPTDRGGETPLHKATSSEVAELLIASGSDIEAADENKYTPLHAAARKGMAAVAEILINSGASMSAISVGGRTPLQMACEWFRAAVVELLIKKGAIVPATAQYGVKSLHDLAKMRLDHRTDRVQTAKNLIDGGINVDTVDGSGNTPLCHAAWDKDPKFVKLLLDCGANASPCDSEGRTPLIIASTYGHIKTVELLLDKGADISATDKDGETALINASLMGETKTVELLLDKGADISATNKNGETALIKASGVENIEIVHILLKNGADVSATNKDGETALIKASKCGKIKTVELLLDKGADISATNKNGETAIQVAIHRGHPDIANILRKRGTDL
ncbi:hypothetical protein E8E14_008004 [Neopestalotiopsis sp. 37M]|nr:hypothetical protein E8E14_008004 [Neopestalotiopsis sp. 37M]